MILAKPLRDDRAELHPRAFVLMKSGRRLDLLNPDPGAWTDQDLASGLARKPRWGDSSKGGRGFKSRRRTFTATRTLNAPRAVKKLRFSPDAAVGKWPLRGSAASSRRSTMIDNFFVDDRP